MQNRYLRKFYQLPFLMGVMLTMVACSSGTGGFPRVASPPAFDYADGDELRSGMHQLAFELQKLDLALMSEHDDRPEFRQGVVTSLTNIERIGEFLQDGDISTRHSFLRGGMQRFLADVSRARADASRSRPVYYMAGRVSGSCVSCHRANE